MRTRTLLLSGLAAVAALSVILVILVQPGLDEPAAPGSVSGTAPSRARSAALPAAPSRAQGVVPSATAGTSASDHGSPGDIGTTDPSSKAYDPMTLIQATQATPAELMNKEPRDPAFAGPREIALRDRIAARFRKRFASDAKLSVQCRTSICEITLERSAEWKDLDTVARALDLVKLSSGAAQIGPSTGDDGSVGTDLQAILVYSARDRDHATYEGLLREHAAQDALPQKAP